jgi:hypothetical protein
MVNQADPNLQVGLELGHVIVQSLGGSVWDLHRSVSKQSLKQLLVYWLILVVGQILNTTIKEASKELMVYDLCRSQ